MELIDSCYLNSNTPAGN